MLGHLVEDRGEFELKYTFPNHIAPMLDSWLSLACKADGEYSESRVHSVYFETMNGESYSEKANSDFIKTKFRVRWYEDVVQKPCEDDEKTILFLEKKMKIGAKRLKDRWSVYARKKEVRTTTLTSPFHQQWHGVFNEKEGEVIAHCHPFIQISYIRKRFVESFTGARLSLDFDIRVEKSNDLLLPPPVKRALPISVFEVKGSSDTVPASLHFLTKNFVRKANFSKYESCVSFLNSDS